MEYEVIRSNRRSMGAQIKGGRLIIRVPLRTTNAQIRLFLQRHRGWIEKHLAKAQVRETARKEIRKLTQEEIDALAKRARKVIPERVAYYAPLVDVTYGRISIRKQKTRWGSCSSKGNLNFNCLLMMAPPEVVDSVVVHELCHRKEMNHSDKFYAEVLRVYPDYWAQYGWLKENGDYLMMMLD